MKTDTTTWTKASLTYLIVNEFFQGPYTQTFKETRRSASAPRRRPARPRRY